MAELALGPGTKANAKIVEGFSVLLTTLVRTEARVEAVEATVIKYCGVFKPAQEYRRGDLVNFDGSVFHCNADPRCKPGNRSTSWTLYVKRGADGKDAERRRIPTGTRR